MTVIAPDTDAALAGVADGATVLVGGFGTAGQPVELIDALIRTGARDLTIVSNNAGNGDHGLAALLAAGQVRRVVCSFPRQSDSWVFDELYRAGKIELEVVPQGTLAERIRAAGAGIGPSSARPASARRWPRARRPGPSTAATMSSSTPSAATSPWSRHTSRTRAGTSSTARPRATSVR